MQLDGPLFFPVTPFGDDGAVAEDVFAEYIERNAGQGAGAIFPACGTGESSSLSEAEVARLVMLALQHRPTGVPVFVGTGGGVGAAIARIREAAALGADAYCCSRQPCSPMQSMATWTTSPPSRAKAHCRYWSTSGGDGLPGAAGDAGRSVAPSGRAQGWHRDDRVAQPTGTSDPTGT